MSETEDTVEATSAMDQSEEASMDMEDVPADNEVAGSEEEEEEDDDDPGEEHEFEIIDQVESEEEGENEEGKGDEGQKDGQRKSKDGGNNSHDYTSSSDDLDDSELHAMLEKGIDKETLRKQDGRPIIKHKIVLREFESDPFDILPERWVCVTHNCGMPVYLHKETRVCTMARPYSLGSASARMHDIPISAIPCLQYRKQLEKEKKANKEQMETDEPGSKTDYKAESGKQKEKLESGPECNISDTTGKVVAITLASCPISTSESKAAQPKMWVVSEESFSKCPQNEQKEALHTGTEGYVSDKSMFGAVMQKTSVGQPTSPGEENIAVSLDSSSCQDKQTVSNLSAQTDGAEDAAMPITVASTTDNTSVCPVNHAEEKSCSTSQAASESSDMVQPQKTLSRELTVSRSHPSLSDARKEKDMVEDSCEEGEIRDDEQMKYKSELTNERIDVENSATSVPSATSSSGQGHLISPTQVSAVVSDKVNDSPPASASTDNNVVHVVREEATSSLEPSEMVTSSTSPLATIKRKIESLKNKNKAKHRRLDNGSAVGWPTENNIAVKPLSMSIGDASNAAQSISTNEKLKANAAGVKIMSAEERAKESLLGSSTVHEYCSKLFQFKTLEVKKYRSWRERRRHLDEKSRRNLPELPPSTKLITCPIPGNMKPEEGGESIKKREFILNPTGKSYLCILHEYMQRTLKIQPLYVFKELENSKTPYGATVTINNIEYGTGYASSKKVAKQEAAKETLKVLIPDLFKKITDQEIKRNISDLSFFDEIKVTDPRVTDLGNKVGQPSPFQLLLECLRRNFGMGNTQCEVSTKPLKNQKCEFTISVGKHSATVVAKNKREGKQLAAQAILAKLHPHVPSWGSLLRLYGTSVEKPVQKPEEMNDIKSHAPNHSVLESLRDEMKKLHKQKEAIQSKGKIIISSKDLPGKMSSVDL